MSKAQIQILSEDSANIKSDIEEDLAKLRVQLDAATESREDARTEANAQKVKIVEFENNVEELTEQLASSEKAMGKLQARHDELTKEHGELEVVEKDLREKLSEVQADVSEKVDVGHSSVKKMVDIQKTNEDISQQLIEKSKESTELLKKVAELEHDLSEIRDTKESQESELQAQKLAYDGVLESMQKMQSTDEDSKEQIELLKQQLKALQMANAQILQH